MASEGKADPARLLISGGSAGGFTTLAALTFLKVFSAGTSFYGISDIEAFAKEIPKFESHYMETLIGPYPEEKQTYWDRSPIHHTDQLKCALAIFQGSEDKVSFFVSTGSLSLKSFLFLFPIGHVSSKKVDITFLVERSSHCQIVHTTRSLHLGNGAANMSFASNLFLD